MRAQIFLLFLIFLTVNAKKREKRQMYLCGQYPYQFYSNSPCYQNGGTQQTQLQPGSRCQNGGVYLGWSCQQAAQCQFSTASGILYGQCVNNNCCTQSSSGSRRGSRGSRNTTSNQNCPSNMVRKNQGCFTDYQCASSNNGRRISGKCQSGRCCVPRTSTTNSNKCYSNERHTNRQCSRSQPCLKTSYTTTVNCRSGYCCESSQNGGQSRQTCSGQGGSLVTQSQCNYDNECTRFIYAANQGAMCDLTQRRCCVMERECPTNVESQQGICQQGMVNCAFSTSSAYHSGLCLRGLCCSTSSNPMSYG